MRYLVSTLVLLVLGGSVVFADAEDSAAPLISPNELLRLLKDRAEPFDNIEIVWDISGKEEIVPSFSMRDPSEPAPPSLVTIRYRQSKTVMIRGNEVTFEKKILSQESTHEGYSISDYQKWGNVRGHVRDLASAGDERLMELGNLSTNESVGKLYAREALLGLGFGIGRYIKTIDSVSNGEDGEILVRGTVAFGQEPKVTEGDCVLRLRDDFFPIEIHIECKRNENLSEIYDIQIGEVGNYGKHLYGKSGKIVSKEVRSGLRDKVFASYTYETKSVRLGISNDEYSKFVDMPITPDMVIIDPEQILAPWQPDRDKYWMLRLLFFIVGTVMIIIGILSLMHKIHNSKKEKL